MIKNLNVSKNGPYSEVFDIERLVEIAELAKGYVKNDKRHIKSEAMKYVPDAHFSDFEVSVWQIMNGLVRYGTELGQEPNKEDL